MAAETKKKNKGRKIDRNRKSAQNLRYVAERRHEKSHLRRIKAHLAKHPTDAVAIAALEGYGGGKFKPSEAA